MTRWLGVLLALCATPLAAQQDSLMLEAVRLVTEGQGDSARMIVQGQLRAVPATDPLYPEVLFTAGVVSADEESALAYFRRVSIEYSNSDWADQALLRLAQLSYAAGDLNAALRSADQVLLDYPFSDVRPHAAFWAARAQLDLGSTASGCRLMQQAQQQAAEDVELANRARFYMQRCSEALAPDPLDSAPQEQDPPEPEPDSGRALYSVQVAAVGSPVAADEVMRQLREAGYESHVMRDADGLLKVRVGRFGNRSEAQALARQIKTRIGGEPFVVEEP
jgi:hypothetical protein